MYWEKQNFRCVWLPLRSCRYRSKHSAVLPSASKHLCRASLYLRTFPQCGTHIHAAGKKVTPGERTFGRTHSFSGSVMPLQQF